MRSAKRHHLPVPSRAQVLSKPLEMEKTTQSIKMLQKARARVVHLGLFQELAPRLVRKEGDGTQFPAALAMRDDFSRDAFLFLHRTVAGGLGTKFEEGFLGICGFSMNQPHQRDQLIP